MQDTTTRWLHIGVRILNAVVMSTLIYLVASGLISGRPWWLVLGAALALPEIARGGLAEIGDPEWNHPASRRTTRLATRTLCTAGMLLVVFGIASM